MTIAKRALETTHLLEPLRRILRCAGRVDRKIHDRYFATATAPKLHIGCGWSYLKGWLNTDYHPKPWNVMHLDATRPFPFGDGTFDYIFSEHMIEHIPYHDGAKMLSECHRVLKPGGKIRIATPDLAFLIDLYRSDLSALQRDYIQWSSRTYFPDTPEDSPAFVINNFVRGWGHIFIYDESTLGNALAKAGFTNIIRRNLQDSDDEVLRNLEYETRMPPGFLRLETLTLEASR